LGISTKKTQQFSLIRGTVGGGVKKYSQYLPGFPKISFKGLFLSGFGDTLTHLQPPHHFNRWYNHLTATPNHTPAQDARQRKSVEHLAYSRNGNQFTVLRSGAADYTLQLQNPGGMGGYERARTESCGGVVEDGGGLHDGGAHGGGARVGAGVHLHLGDHRLDARARCDQSHGPRNLQQRLAERV
jgi:hypothetical protein